MCDFMFHLISFQLCFFFWFCFDLNFEIGCDIFKSPYSMYETRFTDLNITAVSTSTNHADSPNLMSNENQNSTSSIVIQSGTDNVGQHNNNDNTHMNNNHLNHGIKTENQSPPSNGTVEKQDSSR